MPSKSAHAETETGIGAELEQIHVEDSRSESEDMDANESAVQRAERERMEARAERLAKLRAIADQGAGKTAVGEYAELLNAGYELRSIEYAIVTWSRIATMAKGNVVTVWPKFDKGNAAKLEPLYWQRGLDEKAARRVASYMNACAEEAGITIGTKPGEWRKPYARELRGSWGVRCSKVGAGKGRPSGTSEDEEPDF